MVLSHRWFHKTARSAGTSRRRPAWRPACEALESRDVPSGGSSVSIGGKPMVQTRANYLSTIKYLTVAPANQSNPVFRSNNMAAIERLEDPLRREIFNAMANNPVRTFHFTSLAAAQTNFLMRVDIITFMNEVGDQGNPGVNKLKLNFSYWGQDNPPSASSGYWQLVPSTLGPTHQSLEFQSKGPNAYAAIMAITAAPYVGECEGAAEIALLYAAAQVMKQQAFNAMFPAGLVFGSPQSEQPELSIFKLLPMDQQLFVPNSDPRYIHVNTITTQDMVPGDWVYMINTPQYAIDNPNGFWIGENAIYMGQYDSIQNGVPVWRVGATPRFTGLGVPNANPATGQTLANLSASQLAQDLWHAFTGDDSTPPPNSGIGWTIDVGPGTAHY